MVLAAARLVLQCGGKFLKLGNFIHWEIEWTDFNLLKVIKRKKKKKKMDGQVSIVCLELLIPTYVGR